MRVDMQCAFACFLIIVCCVVDVHGFQNSTDIGCLTCMRSNDCSRAYKNSTGAFCFSLQLQNANNDSNGAIDTITFTPNTNETTVIPCCCLEKNMCRVSSVVCRCAVSLKKKTNAPTDPTTESSFATKWLYIGLGCVGLVLVSALYFYCMQTKNKSYDEMSELRCDYPVSTVLNTDDHNYIIHQSKK